MFWLDSFLVGDDVFLVFRLDFLVGDDDSLFFFVGFFGWG